MPYPISNGTMTTSSSELSAQSPTLIPTGYSSSSSIVDAVLTGYGSASASSSSEAGAIPATSSQTSAANGLPSSKATTASEDTTTTSTVRSTRTTTSYTTLYLSSTSASQGSPASSAAAGSSVADSNSASAYSSASKEVKEVSANTANGNAAAATGAATGAEQCGVVTVTATQKVTEYVTVAPSSTDVSPVAGSSSASSSPSSSSVVKPVSSSALYPANNSTQYAPTAYSSATYSTPASSKTSNEAGAVPATSATAPAYAAPSSSSSEAAAVATSAPSAPVYSVPSSSTTFEFAAISTSTTKTSAALIATAYENKGLADAVATSVPVYQSSSIASSSTSAAASQTSIASASTGGKRGLAYNDASLTDCFTGGSEISWAYNWGSSAGDLASGLNFIPLLWGTATDFTSVWSENAKAAISSGSTTLFSFNEPDLAAQSNMSPAAAAAAYKEYMNPFGDSAKLCAPSVTNSGTDGQGLSWLSEFLDACTDCQIDCINIHWYDSAENTDYFKSHIEDAVKVANGKPIYVSEFGATGSDEQISEFLQEVMPYMDSNSNIAGYAYFMVSSGVLVTGTEPSSYGSVYKSYTS